ncbi:MAG: hypothetical protein ACI82I_003496, partial [Gammaproteobacteria bacterium]
AAAIADAAFPRICSGTHFATQRISPDRPFNGVRTHIH